MAQDETALQHKPKCIPGGGGDQTQDQSMAVQHATTKLTGLPNPGWRDSIPEDLRALTETSTSPKKRELSRDQL